MTDNRESAASLHRTELLLQVGRHAEARTEVERYLAQHPDDGAGWAYHAFAVSDHDLGLAQESARRAVALAPESAWVHRTVAIMAGRAGQHDVAIHAAERAVQLAPQEAAGYRVLADHLRHVRGRRHEALAVAQRAVSLAPNDPSCWLAKGNAHLTNNQVDEAEKAYLHVLELEPGHAGALHNLSLCHSVKGNRATAIDLLHTIIASDPRDEVAREQLDHSISRFMSDVQWLAFAVALGLALVTRAIWGR